MSGTKEMSTLREEFGLGGGPPKLTHCIGFEAPGAAVHPGRPL